MPKLRDLAARAVTEKDFRKKLITAPEKTASELGVKLTRTEIEAIGCLRDVDFDRLPLDDIQGRFDDIAERADVFGAVIF